MYVNVYVYMYLPRRELYLYPYPYPYPFLSLPYLPSVPQSLYLYQQKKSKLYRSPFLILPPLPVPLARARVYVCTVCIYMNLWKDSPPCPVRPPRKKKETFASAASPPPPLPCDGSSHIQSQLDKARQDKLPACLPACKRIKKKIRNPPSDNVTMLSNLPTMDYYRGGWPVCLSVYPTCLALSVYLVLSGLPVPSTIRSSHVHAHAMILRGTIPFLYILECIQYIPKACLPGLFTVWSACLVCLGGSIDRHGFLLFFFFC